MINADSILDISYSNTTIELSTVKKLIPSLSGGLALRYLNSKSGVFEIGLSAIYNTKTPESKYTSNRIKYDGIDNSIISDETEEISFSTKNSTIQFYITWYPKFLRITKKIK